jgi:hypothetical protein
MEGSREVTVVPIGSETALRNFAWIEDSRRCVERATKGKAAYVYMPDTAFVSIGIQNSPLSGIEKLPPFSC